MGQLKCNKILEEGLPVKNLYGVIRVIKPSSINYTIFFVWKKNLLCLNFLQHHFAPSTNSFGEDVKHLFCHWTITQCLRKKLQLKLKDNITLLPLTPQVAIFGFLEADCQSYLIQNHILLILKLYIYKSWKSKFLSSTCLIRKNIEKKVVSVNGKKHRI